MIVVQIEGAEEAAEKLDQVARDLTGSPMEAGMRRAALIVTGAARELAPVDTGRLRASITPEVYSERDTVVGVVGSNVVYAPYMELGTRPHWPPVGALDVWARRHGFESEYPVRLAIARRGTAPRRFLQRAVEENEERIYAALEDALTGIVEA